METAWHFLHDAKHQIFWMYSVRYTQVVFLPLTYNSTY
jgi:hypothetical protein